MVAIVSAPTALWLNNARFFPLNNEFETVLISYIVFHFVLL